jgi:hypothetical protein
MRVDQAGQQRELTEIDILGGGRAGGVVVEGDDSAPATDTAAGRSPSGRTAGRDRATRSTMRQA